MPVHENANPPETDLAPLAEQLIRILALQADGHRKLLDCVRQKRDALRRADIDAIAALCHREHDIARRVGDLEKLRLELVGKVTAKRTPHAAKPMTLTQIAHAVGQPQQRELEALATTLKNAIGEVRRESSVVRAATEALGRHMAGLIQTVNGAISRAGVYERKGRIAASGQTALCVDVSS